MRKDKTWRITTVIALVVAIVLGINLFTGGIL